MGVELREYQDRAANAGIKALKGKSNDIIVCPGGGGKSLIAAAIAHRLNEPTLILQPSKEILEQNYSKIQDYGIDDIGIYSASLKSKEIAKYTYATIGSIYKKPELFSHFKYLLVDECHLVNPKDFSKEDKGMYTQFFTSIGNPRVLGLTASPYRMVQKYFKDEEDMYYSAYLQVLNRIYPFFFKKICYSISIEQLYAGGYLAPLEYIIHKDSQIDVSKIPVNSTGADYAKDALEKYLVNAANIEKVVASAIKYDSQIKHNLIFCSSKRQANLVGQKLSSLGFSNEVLTGEDKDRSRKVQDFKSGANKRLIVVDMLTTGFDFPELDCITMGKPTFSLALWYQMCARAMRPDKNNPNKKSLIIDTTNNTARLGRVETIRMGKEEDGFRDTVETEVGTITGKPLYSFKITKEETKEKVSKIL